MPDDRVLYTFPQLDWAIVRLIGVQRLVGAGRIEPRYQLTRGTLQGAYVVLATLSREELAELGGAIVRDVMPKL